MKKLKLSEYIDAIKKAGLFIKTNLSEENENALVKELTYDTRELKENTLFVCKGAHFKEEYAIYAAQSGAVALIGENEYNVPGFVKVTDIRKTMPLLARLFYDNAPEKVTSVGITGTKGKSTVAYYIKTIIDEEATKKDYRECAIVSSINTYDGIESFESHLTTPEAIPLYKHFNNAYESGIGYLVSEVSSQALKYGRVDGITFDIGVFTNIGTDHISHIEHRNFEDYFTSKLKLFETCHTACINTDADFADRTVAEAEKNCNVITFGSHETDDIFCKNIEKRNGATYFSVRTPLFEREFCITMPGLFNVSNALAAIAVGYALGISEESIANGLLKARVPGRMQVYESFDRRITVIVDYAHNKMSFDALFKSTKIEYPDKKIISVFGCPGGKAYQRRFDLGNASNKMSDYIILTEEDSGEEPFTSISSDIAANIDKCPHEIIENRGKAIRHAIFDCFKGDEKVILLTGKGEETRQKRGTEYIDCPSDVEYTLQFLKEYNEALVPTA